MQNFSYENEFYMQFHFHANQTHFHKNCFAVRLALKQRHKRTRKWPIQYTTVITPWLRLTQSLTISVCRAFNLNNKNVNTLIARELSGFNCTRSLTMNSKFSIPHEAVSCGIEISRSLLVNSCR